MPKRRLRMHHNPSFLARAPIMLVVAAILLSVLAPLPARADGEEEAVPVETVQIATDETVEAPPPAPEPEAEPEPVAPEPDPVQEAPAPQPKPINEAPTPAPVQPEQNPVIQEPAPDPAKDEPAVPTETPEPTEEPIVWVNRDALWLTDGGNTFTLQPGAAQAIRISYAVTTPRTGTTIHAQLAGAGEGWQLASPELGDADAAPHSARWTQPWATEPETSFVLPIVITAPVTVAETHTVSLHVWSTAAGLEGEETGVAYSTDPHATLTAVAPPPTEAPETEPDAQEPEGEEPVASETAEAPAETPTSTTEPTEEEETTPEVEETPTSTPNEETSPEPSETPASEPNAVEAIPVPQPIEQIDTAVQDARSTMETIRESGTSLVEITADIAFSCEPEEAQINDDGIASFQCNVPWGKTFVDVTGMPKVGWEIQLSEDGTWKAYGWTDAQPQVTYGGNQKQFFVGLKHVEGNTPASITVTARNEGNQMGSADLTATLSAISDPTKEELEVTCDPIGGITWQGSSNVSCTLSSSASKAVNITQVTVTSPAGWSVGDGADPNTYILTPSPDIWLTSGAEWDFPFTLARTACQPSPGSIEIVPSFTYEGDTTGPHVGIPTALTPALAPVDSIAPTITTEDVDFGTLTWNGASWGTATEAMTIAVDRSTACDEALKPYGLQISIPETAAKLGPTLVTTGAKGGIAVQPTAVGAGGTATIANVPSGFKSTGAVDLQLAIAPTDQAEPGTHRFTIEITTIQAP